MTLQQLTDYFRFLDELRDSGKINMWGARPYLVDAFDELTPEAAGTVVSQWMRTCDQTSTPGQRAARVELAKLK